MHNRSSMTLRHKQFLILLSVIVLIVIAAFWIEILTPIQRFFGVARSLEVPICSCTVMNFPGDGSPPDQEIDLDPTVDDYSKASWTIKNSDGDRIRIRYSTREQLYNYLVTIKPGICLASSYGPLCMKGRIILTEIVDNKSILRPYGGVPCEFPTAFPNEWSTPAVNVFRCLPGLTEMPSHIFATNPPPLPGIIGEYEHR